MTGTDIEVELIAEIDLAQEAIDGQITVPAKKIFDIVRSLPEQAPITLTQSSIKVYQQWS